MTPIADGVDRVHRVLGVDVRAHAAVALRLGDDVHRERRLARGLGAEDLDDPPAGQAADPEREVERERTGRDGLDPDVAVLTEAHDRALAELLLDLAERHVECLLTFHRGPSLGAGLSLSIRSRAVRTRGKRLARNLRRGCDSYAGESTEGPS